MIDTYSARGGAHTNVHLGDQFTEELRDFGRSAGSALDLPIAVVDCDYALPAKRMLASVWDETVSAIETSAASGHAQPDHLAQLTTLLTQVRELEARVDDARVVESVTTMRRIRDALSRLDNAATVDELFELAAEQACTLGFDRALVSTVDESTWNLRTMHIERDPAMAREMIAIGREEPPMLDGALIESDVVTQGRPGTVHGVQEHPRVARQLVSVSGCTSYCVAPMKAAGQVIGLVHADSFYTGHQADSADRAVLDLFAGGLSTALGRVSAIQGIGHLQAGLAELAVAMPAGRTIPVTAPQDPQASPSHARLSDREVDVLELLSAGHSNRIIARRLCISEGTVKTHVTHILRKLDASNRAEAVAYWLRGGNHH